MPAPCRALIIFAKRPVPGQVKTRLCPPLTPLLAAELYDCMLRDVLAKADRLPGVSVFLYYQDEPDAARFFHELCPAFSCRPQKGADLGARMASAFQELFAEGFYQAAIIGTDLPDLPMAHLHQAYAMLDDATVDAVYGPSEDGGYYLLGLKEHRAVLFEGIPWSTGDVLCLSLERAAVAGIRTALLPVWHDVDDIADLQRPALRLETNDAPLTRAFIVENLD